MFSTVGVGLWAKDPSSLCTSTLQHGSTTGGRHSFAKAMNSGQRLSRPVPFGLPTLILYSPNY